MGKHIRRFAILALATVSALSFGQDVVVPLTDGGSAVQLNAGTSASSGPLGTNSWTIGGTQELAQQLFLLSIDNHGVQPINDFSAPMVNQPSSHEAIIGYTGSNFVISVDYVLTGIAPDLAKLTESVTLIDTSASSITYNLLDLNHFKLDGATGGTVTLLDPDTLKQVRNTTTGLYGVTAHPTHWAINTFSSVVSSCLNGGDLPDSSSPFTDPDSAFAFQWRGTIETGQSFQFTTVHLVAVPEPASLLALGGLAVMAIRRRKRTAK